MYVPHIGILYPVLVNTDASCDSNNLVYSQHSQPSRSPNPLILLQRFPRLPHLLETRAERTKHRHMITEKATGYRTANEIIRRMGNDKVEGVAVFVSCSGDILGRPYDSIRWRKFTAAVSA